MHFDGFASMSSYKSDAEMSMLRRIEDEYNFRLVSDKEVVGMLYAEEVPLSIIGVYCADA